MIKDKDFCKIDLRRRKYDFSRESYIPIVKEPHKFTDCQCSLRFVQNKLPSEIEEKAMFVMNCDANDHGNVCDCSKYQ